MTEPIVDRPGIPAEYGVSTDTAQLLPWSHVVQRLTDATVYWIATVGHGARPRVRPIDGTFLDGVLYVGGSPETAWVRDLSANGEVSVNLDGAERMDVVIVEGDAEWLQPPLDPGWRRELAAATNAKYPQYGMQSADTVRRPGLVGDPDHLGRRVDRFRQGPDAVPVPGDRRDLSPSPGTRTCEVPAGPGARGCRTGRPSGR